MKIRKFMTQNRPALGEQLYPPPHQLQIIAHASFTRVPNSNITVGDEKIKKSAT